MKRIEFDRGRKCFVLSDGTSSDRDGAFPLETTLDLSLAGVRRALAVQGGMSIPPLKSLPSPDLHGSYLELIEALTDGEICIEDDEPWDVVFFHLTKQGHLRASFSVEHPAVTERNTVIEITSRVFGRVCILIEFLHYTKPGDDDFPHWSFDMICNPTAQTVGSFWRAYSTLRFALTTSPGDLVKSSEGVQLALRLGHPEVLIGVPECSWLEAKSYDYRRLSSGVEKIKLAQDVARFANADGGLLVLGLETALVNSHRHHITGDASSIPGAFCRRLSKDD